MGDAFKRLVSSAKFWTAIIALVSVVAARYGFDLSEQMTALVAAIFAVLLGAQGAADAGKEAAKVAPPKSSVTAPQVVNVGVAEDKRVVSQ